MKGSELVVHSVADGQEAVVYACEQIIEAPNWSADGRALYVNGDGHLFRLALGTVDLEMVDTGFANKLNNDHGISPNGQLMAISDKVETGKSCIYLMPAEGGALRRWTEAVPSYFHAWSPDGQRPAYCAKRDGAFGIATIGVEGGEETLLTDGKGHSDGPDYSADGEWIWFNSDREGHAQIWRMRVNGSDLEQMTSDERVNWFPHPSPDGETVLYLSYPAGTEGHPAGLDVELRMMSAEGGECRTVAAFYGGQGSINVPCWAPDGTRFAYMRYLRD